MGKWENVTRFIGLFKIEWKTQQCELLVQFQNASKVNKNDQIFA
jgi:hypothetical protein